MTVLFADVVHSMDIAAAVGAERLREIMAELFDRSSVVVKRYGGTVDKFTGDGIMAVFGAPITLEDHAIRACIAALEIQNQTTALAADVNEPRRHLVAVAGRAEFRPGHCRRNRFSRCQLHGRRRTGRYGAADGIGSAARRGDAQRVDGPTGRERGTARRETNCIGSKAQKAPVKARQLLAIEEHQPRHRSETALVGRARELNFLTAVLEEAVGGAGCVVNIVGPPGIGKSRLAREIAALAAGRGAAVVTAHCESHTSDVPFRAISRLFRASMGIDQLDDAAARAQVRARFSDADERRPASA